MTKNWFFQRDGQQHGPFTADELRQQASEGQLQPHDLVWREGMSQPVEARLVPTLFLTPTPSFESSEH